MHYLDKKGQSMLVTEAALKQQDGNFVSIETPFGEVVVSEDLIIHFPQGILGFEGLNHFAFLDVPNHGTDSEYRLLQSLEDPNFCLVISTLGDLVLKRDIIPYLEEKDLQIDSIGLWSILSFDRGSHARVTANLKAPLVVDFAARQGWQIILYHADYPVDFPLPYAE